MFKVGDKVRFISKNGGAYSLEELEDKIELYLIRDCFGVIVNIWGREPDYRIYLYNIHTKEKIGCSIWEFNEEDLIPFEDIDYDSLSEIEE